MTGLKIVAAVVGALGVLLGAALIAGGSTILTGDQDDDGFYISEEYRFEQPSYAIVSEDIDIVLSGTPTWVIDWIIDPVDLRISGTGAGGRSLFIGIAGTTDVDRYLSGVAHHEVTRLDFRGSSVTDVEYRSQGGTASPTSPANEGFWVASTEGVGPQTLDWSLESGSWTVVVMNSDASAGVDADLAFGADIPYIAAIAWFAVAFGLIFLLGGGYLVYWAVRRTEPERAAGPGDELGAPPVEPPPPEKKTALKS